MLYLVFNMFNVIGDPINIFYKAIFLILKDVGFCQNLMITYFKQIWVGQYVFNIYTLVVCVKKINKINLYNLLEKIIAVINVFWCLGRICLSAIYRRYHWCFCWMSDSLEAFAVFSITWWIAQLWWRHCILSFTKSTRSEWNNLWNFMLQTNTIRSI